MDPSPRTRRLFPPRRRHGRPPCRGAFHAVRRGAFAAVLLAFGLATAQYAAAVQELAAYPGAVGRPLEEKISLGTEAVLDWQHRINLQYGEDIRPRKGSPDHPLIPVVRKMVMGLPARVRELAARHVVALYLLQEDFGTGTTEAVRDEKGAWRYGYIALNLTELQRTANEWGAWKEGSTFRPERGHEVRMVLEPSDSDDVEGAVRFIFLHELGHVLGLALAAHGVWDAKELPSGTRHSPFILRSWKVEDGKRMVSRWRGEYPLLSRLSFYQFDEAKLSLPEAEATYRALAETNFPSLYGATNPFDDFAETFAIYVHTRLLGKPYRVEVYRAGERRLVYRSCLQAGTCAKKVAALEALLGIR